jgi:uncharacterized membrane protein
MPTTLANPFFQVSARAVVSSGTFPPLTSVINHNPTIALGAGSTAGNINLVYQVGFAITTGTPWTVNVNTGTDPYGMTLSMVHVAAIIVENDSTTTGQDFTIGGGTHSVLGSDSYFCQANGGVICIVNPSPGYTVSSGSTDTLTIAVAAGTGVAGRITIFGRNA